MSVMEAVAQTTDWGLTSYSVIRKLGLYGEVRDGGGKSYPILPCKDGFVSLCDVTIGGVAQARGHGSASPAEILGQDYWEQRSTVRIELFDDLLRPDPPRLLQGQDRCWKLSRMDSSGGIPITPMLRPADVLRAEPVPGPRVRSSTADFELGEVGADSPAASSSSTAGRIGLSQTRRLAPGRTRGVRATDLVPTPGRIQSATVEPPPGRPFARPARGRVRRRRSRARDGPLAGRVWRRCRSGSRVPRRTDLFRQLGGPDRRVGSAFVSSNRVDPQPWRRLHRPGGSPQLVIGADHRPPTSSSRTCASRDARALSASESEDDPRANPSVLLVSSQTMGRRGPWSHWRGYGANTQLPAGHELAVELPRRPRAGPPERRLS